MVQVLQFFSHGLLDFSEINTDPDLVQLRALDSDLNVPVMTVQVFAISQIVPQRVGGREMLFHFYFKYTGHNTPS